MNTVSQSKDKIQKIEVKTLKELENHCKNLLLRIATAMVKHHGRYGCLINGNKTEFVLKK